MNNVFTNPNFTPYGTAPMGSAYAPQHPPIPKNTQPLTKEEIAKLQKDVERFSTKLTEEDILKSRCTHRTNNDSTLVQNSDGSFTCAICGENIMLEEYTPQQVEEIVSKFVNLLDVIKVQFMDLPVDVACEFFQIIPYCKRVPQLYEIAHENFSRYAGYNPIGANPVNQNPSYNVWNSFNQMTGGMGAYPYYQGYLYYGQQPMAGGYYPNNVQPQQQTGMQYASPTQMQQNQMLMGNPMYTAEPQQQSVINAQQAPVQPQQPVNNTQQAPVPQSNNDMATTTAQVQL